VIVPRHPQRFDRVARLVQASGLTLARRSQWGQGEQQPSAQTAAYAVLLGDSLGEMFAYLEMADLVLMGGSLPNLGGQNPVEACAVGRPVYFGPNMFNFYQIARALKACGAGREITTTDEWIGQGRDLLLDQPAYTAAVTAAQAFAKTHRGATARTTAFLETILQANR